MRLGLVGVCALLSVVVFAPGANPAVLPFVSRRDSSHELAALRATVQAAHSASKHEVFLQHAWHRFEEKYRAHSHYIHRSVTAYVHHAVIIALTLLAAHRCASLHSISGDWSDWEETWRRHDHDKDGNIKVNIGEVSCALALAVARRLTQKRRVS